MCQKNLRLFLTCCVALCFVGTRPAFAIQVDSVIAVFDNLEWLNWNGETGVSVGIINHADDKCWLNTTLTENAVKLELIRSSVSVQEAAPYRLIMLVDGFDPGSGQCVMNLNLMLDKEVTTNRFADNDKLQIVGFWNSQIYHTTKLVSKSRSGVDEYIKNQFVEMTQVFLLQAEKRHSSVISQIKADATPEQMRKIVERYHIRED